MFVQFAVSWKLWERCPTITVTVGDIEPEIDTPELVDSILSAVKKSVGNYPTIENAIRFYMSKLK